MADKKRERTLVSLPDATIAKLTAFRDREWAYIPKDTRADDVTWNAVVLRLLAIEEHTRPAPARQEKRRPRALLGP